jgi:hypothetical protein
MPIEAIIKQNGIPARVTKSGELVVGQLSYDETFYNEMSATGTAYNFFVPKAGKQFIITGFLAVSDKNITADAIVEIYEASGDSSTTVDKALPKFAMTKNAVVSPTPLRILVTEGVWVNAKTDDATIHLTMFGYYIDVVTN